MSKQIKMPSNRNFGLVFCVIFSLIGIYPLIFNQEIKLIFLILAIIFLLLGIMNSKILTPLNKLWMKFGYFMGKIISPLVMLMIFYLVITPIAVFLRIIGKDVLKKNKIKVESYWIKKEEIKSTMKDQF